MALIKFSPMAYIKYFALNAPMILAAFTILASAFNKDIKGLIFMTGAVIIMFIGQFISSSLGRKVPRGNGIDLEACNLFSSGGWGYIYSSPAPNALFLSYAAAYLILAMALNQNFNWGLLGILIVIMGANAGIRVQLLRCIGPIDIMFGWFFGILWAFLWYGLMSMMEAQYDGMIPLVYFGDEINGDKCKLTNKKFKCRKI
jgi:hypothetical protein